MTKSVMNQTTPFIGMNFKNLRLKGREILVKGLIIPDKHKVVIEDLNFRKTDTKICLDLYILDSKLISMPHPVLKNITSSTSGVGKVMLEAGQCLALLLRGKGDGRSRLNGFASGRIMKVK